MDSAGPDIRKKREQEEAQKKYVVKLEQDIDGDPLTPTLPRNAVSKQKVPRKKKSKKSKYLETEAEKSRDPSIFDW